jgi:hypothetical protein
MAMANNEAERCGAILALKELSRQAKRLMQRSSEISLEEAGMPELGDQLRGILNGEISPVEAEIQNERTEERIEQSAIDADSPEIILGLRAEKEAKTKGLSPAAQLLASDSNRAASDGLSKEQWISEVLNGHESDEWAQLGCLKQITALWTEGPWPWPRDLTVKA